MQVYLLAPPPNSALKVESESCSVLSNSLRPQRLYSPWNSPGQNTGVGSLSLLQQIFSTQGSNPGLPHCRRILYQLSHKGNAYSSLLLLLLLLLSHFSRVRLFETPLPAAHLAPLPMGFSRQEYWSALPLPSLYSSLGHFKFTGEMGLGVKPERLPQNQVLVFPVCRESTSDDSSLTPTCCWVSTYRWGGGGSHESSLAIPVSSEFIL